VGRQWTYLLALCLLLGCGSTSDSTQRKPAVSPSSARAETGSTSPTESATATSATGESTSPPATAKSDEVAIVAAAAVQRVTKDNSPGQPPVGKPLNIIDRYGAIASDGFLAVKSQSPEIDTAVRAAIEKALEPLPIVWVASMSEVIGTDGHLPSSDEEVGAVLTLGAPIVDGPHATITTELWCGGLCGAGSTYTVERTDPHGWHVTGITGPEWMA
jgi:hypothetical protein